MDARTFGVVRDMFEYIDGSVPYDSEDQTTRARRLFAALAEPGGQVEALGEPRVYRSEAGALGTWDGDPWGEPTYAIDASTTRPIEYNNGLLLDTAHARLGVAGADADRHPERRGTVKTVVHFEDSESTLNNDTFGTGDDIAGEVVCFRPNPRRQANLSKSVASVAQKLAEGEHAAACLDHIDGALFLDGSVYPLGILYWVLLDDLGGRSPAGVWDRPDEIVENYVEVVEAQYEKGLPVVGVVKTSTSRQVLDALERKLEDNDVRTEAGRRLTGSDVPWMRDNQFVAEVLGKSDLDTLAYTSWFVKKKRRINGEHVEGLETCRDGLRFGEPEDYRRAFFYVRLPTTGVVFRVETPLLMADDEEERRNVQLKALKEIAQREDVPRAIKRADRMTNISNENRESIRKLPDSIDPYYDFNRNGRFSDIDDQREIPTQR